MNEKQTQTKNTNAETEFFEKVEAEALRTEKRILENTPIPRSDLETVIVQVNREVDVSINLQAEKVISGYIVEEIKEIIGEEKIESIDTSADKCGLHTTFELKASKLANERGD